MGEPTTHRRWARGRGRPRLGRNRRQFLPRVSSDLAARLDAQAQAAGMASGPYLEVLICAVHDTWTPFVQPPAAPLPTAVPMDELRARAAHFTTDELYAPLGHDVVLKSVRVDDVVADAVDARCQAYDATYADYLRAIFRAATGLPTSKPLAAAQPRLPEGSDAHLAEAS